MSEKIPKRYVPDSLTEKQKKKQIESIKKGVDRPKLKGVKTRKSKWTVMAHKYFGESPSLQDIKKKLGLKSITGLKKIIEKGEAAYYSSGSRPNVSAEQWGRARLYSVLFGGKSRNIDKEIVEKYNIPLIDQKCLSNENKPNCLNGGSVKKMKMFELFKGSGSVGKAANKLGFEVVSLDFDPIYTPDIETDILKWNYKKWIKENNFIPDFIWASPPCNTFSPLAYPLKERNTKTAKPYSKRAKLGTKIAYKTLEIINYCKTLNHNLLYCIENPRGMLRNDIKYKKLPFRATTRYCLWDGFKNKPTDFWSNFFLDLKYKTNCGNKKTISVEKIKDIKKRYSIPQKLLTHILKKAYNDYGKEIKKNKSQIISGAGLNENSINNIETEEELKGGDVSNLKNKEDVEDAKEYALSDKDLKNLIPNTNIFTYPELENIRHIDEVFKKNKNGVETAIMLYLTEAHNIGHWIGLIKKGNTIEFFDPYGQELKKVGKFLGGKMEKYQDPQLLKDKIKEAGYKLIENNKKHQPVSDDINTCGRHTALRIMFGHLSLDEYNKLMNEIKKKHNLNSDDLATFMTYDILDK